MRSWARGLVAAAAVLLTAAGASATPAAAAPVPTTEVITGQHLQLESITSAEMVSMTPGETASWDVGVSVLTEGRSVVDLTLAVLDATPGAFEVTVSRCAERWQAAGCPGGAATLATPAVVTGSTTAIDTVDSEAADGEPWYRMSVTFVGGDEVATASLRLHAVGEGEEVTAGNVPDPEEPGATGAPGQPGTPGLPGTGADPWRGVATAAAAITVGLVLAGLARRRADAAEGGAA